MLSQIKPVVLCVHNVLDILCNDINGTGRIRFKKYFREGSTISKMVLYT